MKELISRSAIIVIENILFYILIGVFPFCQKNYYVIIEGGAYINDS